jgi:Fe2+ transport system protein FeoA
MFGLGKGFGKHRRKERCGRRHRRFQCASILTEAEVGKKYIILNNPDIKTMEMGLYRGGIITVHKNEEDNPNIVVGVGESRYIIPRELAEKIHIK